MYSCSLHKCGKVLVKACPASAKWGDCADDEYIRAALVSDLRQRPEMKMVVIRRETMLRTGPGVDGSSLIGENYVTYCKALENFAHERRVAPSAMCYRKTDSIQLQIKRMPMIYQKRLSETEEKGGYLDHHTLSSEYCVGKKVGPVIMLPEVNFESPDKMSQIFEEIFEQKMQNDRKRPNLHPESVGKSILTRVRVGTFAPTSHSIITGPDIHSGHTTVTH
ncbi:hypothetical protein BDZ89DRAFT_1043861 [Hymenopellis radicata]|nr:hypothetical protein BDZ89DRAFT_1043861 [Hymenopellis radicata]